jgi:hypothetical protein
MSATMLSAEITMLDVAGLASWLPSVYVRSAVDLCAVMSGGFMPKPSNTRDTHNKNDAQVEVFENQDVGADIRASGARPLRRTIGGTISWAVSGFSMRGVGNGGGAVRVDQ